MAESEQGQPRTEAPTQRRREEARQQGQVAVSSDLSGGLILLAGILVLLLGAKVVADDLLTLVRQGLSYPSVWGSELAPESVQGAFVVLFRRGMDIIGLLLGLLLLVAVAAGVLQAGFYMVPVAMNWERLSPANGWSRIISLAAGVRGLIAVLKVAAVGLLVWWILKGRSAQIATLGEGSVASAAAHGWDIAIRLTLAMAAAMVLIGALDYAFQRWRLEQSLRMTRQELKEELKREEGDPQIKARIRRLQRERARRRMLEEVPRAAVVITNPTHLAVALRYERGTMPAPRLVAKGAGFVAARIVELARNHAVPVVERKDLAQALYKAVDEDQEIPAALYQAAAEVLAFIYRLRGLA